MGGPDPRGRRTHHGREVLSHPPSRRRCCGREVEKVAKIGDVHNRVTVPPVYKGRPLAGDYCGDNPRSSRIRMPVAPTYAQSAVIFVDTRTHSLSRCTRRRRSPLRGCCCGGRW
jgi:hypothetical protein